MIKKLFNALMIVLAMNFLAAVGGIAYLFNTGALTKEKIADIRAVVFPPPADPIDESAATEDAPLATPKGSLDQLLAAHSTRPLSEQVDFMQQRFDAQMAMLSRRGRELADQQRQIELAQRQLVKDREQFAKDRSAFEAHQQQAVAVVEDAAFEAALELYTRMPAKQAKQVFAGLDDDTVIRYLRAMDARAASRIIKEFKAPQEIQQIQRILETMRKAGVPAELATTDAAASS